MPFTFGKEERLCSRKLIDRLYAEGHRLMAFPFSVQWIATEGPEPCQVMIVRKPALYTFLQEHNVCIALSLVYIHNEIMSYEQLCHKTDKLVAALEQEIAATL